MGFLHHATLSLLGKGARRADRGFFCIMLSFPFLGNAPTGRIGAFSSASMPAPKELLRSGHLVFRSSLYFLRCSRMLRILSRQRKQTALLFHPKGMPLALGILSHNPAPKNREGHTGCGPDEKSGQIKSMPSPPHHPFCVFFYPPLMPKASLWDRNGRSNRGSKLWELMDY